jgi:hypothetical protein
LPLASVASVVHRSLVFCPSPNILPKDVQQQ